MANEYGRARIKASKPFRPNVKANRVGKSKGSGCGKKKNSFLAGPGKKKMASVGGAARDQFSAPNRKKKRAAAGGHPLANAFTGEFGVPFFFFLTR